jgi:hypothetical protein
MDDGGRHGGGEEERRSVSMVPGALREGAVSRKGSRRSSTIPHYTRCAMSAKHDA